MVAGLGDFGGLESVSIGRFLTRGLLALRESTARRLRFPDRFQEGVDSIGLSCQSLLLFPCALIALGSPSLLDSLPNKPTLPAYISPPLAVSLRQSFLSEVVGQLLKTFHV